MTMSYGNLWTVEYVTFFFMNSWVHTQLKNHPDELWEDGVQDYLAHASKIMVISGKLLAHLESVNIYPLGLQTELV